MNFIRVKSHKTIKLIWLLLILVAGGCAVQQPPLLTPFGDGEYWVLGNDLVYRIGDTGQEIVVPRGFVTDLASVPRLFWTLFPRHGQYTRATIVHDFLYWEQKCSREQADALFDIMMENSAVDSASRFTMYATVRLWGDSAWQENASARRRGYVRVIPERYINFPAETRWLNYQDFLRQMMEEDETAAAFPLSTPPAYCSAL